MAKYSFIGMVLLVLSGLLASSQAISGGGADSTQNSDSVSTSLCWPNCAGSPPPEWRYYSSYNSGMEPCDGSGGMWDQWDIYYYDSNNNNRKDSGEQTQKRNWQSCSSSYACGWKGCRSLSGN